MTMQPPIDYARLAKLAEEFTTHWERLQALYLDCVVGFHYIIDHLRAEQMKAGNFVAGNELDSEEFQDTRMFDYEDILPDDFCTSGIHRATQGEVKSRNKEGGMNYSTLGQLCIVSFYDFWEGYLRTEYVKAKGLYDPSKHRECLRDHASNDLWGDMRYLREAIVHHQGIATGQIAKAKVIKCFKPGDKIEISPYLMRAIFLALLTFRNELFHEQLPPFIL